jgi:hypothetical protein
MRIFVGGGVVVEVELVLAVLVVVALLELLVVVGAAGPTVTVAREVSWPEPLNAGGG